jgi:hypothetical protein
MIKFIKFLQLLLLLIFTLIFTNSCENEDQLGSTSFPAGKALALFCDSSGTVWAGTDIGIISFSDGKWRTYKNITELTASEVTDIEFRNSNTSQELWLATQGGAVAVKYLRDEITSATLYTKEQSGLLDNNVTDILEGAQEARWFATPKGLAILRGSKWYSETSWGDLVTHQVICMGAEDDGWIFAGTRGFGVGRFRYDESIDGITGASYYNTEWSGLPSDTILSVYLDHNNNQWFGTNRGVACHTVWETKTGWKVYTTVDGLVNNRVQAITEDDNGLIWFGTADGISSFDGNTWKSYAAAEGLSDTFINDIDIDKDGNVWVATNGGMSVFNGSIWKNHSR